MAHSAHAWLRAVVVLLLWGGSAALTALSVQLLGAEQLSLSPFWLAVLAGLTGAIFVAISLALARVEFPRPDQYVRTFLAVLIPGTILLCLSVSGIAFAILAPSLPFEPETELLVFLLGLLAPVAGSPALIATAFLRPRSWLVERLPEELAHRASLAALAPPVGIVLAIWLVAGARYISLTPSTSDEAIQLREETALREELRRLSEQKVAAASDFLQSAAVAAQTFLLDKRVTSQAVQSGLQQCLLSSGSVVACGILDRQRDYQEVRATSQARCGYCSHGACQHETLPSHGKNARHSRLHLPGHLASELASITAANWAEPKLLGGTNCEELSYVVPTEAGQLVVVLSLLRLSQTLQSAELPKWQAFITDSRGYVIGTSTSERYTYDGDRINLCMTLVDCGGRAAQARALTISSLAERRPEFSVPHERYSRWLGHGSRVPVLKDQADPHWLFSAIVLGPDM